VSNFYDYIPAVDEIAYRKSLTRDSDTFKSILTKSRDFFFDATEDRADNIPDAENSNVTAESDKSVSGSTSSSNSTGQGQTEERVPTASSSNSTGQGQNEERVPTVVADDRSQRQTPRPMLSAYCNSFTFLQRFYNRKVSKQVLQLEKMSRSTQSTSATGSTDEGLGFNEITVPPSDEASSLFEQQQRQLLASINEIQRNLLSLNKPYLDCMADATINGLKCKGKNDTRQGKKTKMSPIDTWNAHVLSNFLRDSIWPTNKILPKKWTHWVNDNRSLSQKVIAKVTIPQGISPQEYWERMLVGMANKKFCALRSNIKQTLFLQYEGSSYA
jgi:hypothetical protein